MNIVKIFLSFVLAFSLIAGFSQTAYFKVSAAGAAKPDRNGVKVAYIPIDNRPVNFERVKYLAQSVGIELVMPDENLFRTALDNMEPNPDGTTYGDREGLVEWLKSVEGRGDCDYYVLSLDQLLSGGLASSRWFSNTDLTLEYSIADYIAELSKNNTVVLFDTVMRLASTVNYQGYQMSEYSQLRSYGAAARKVLAGGELNVENIIACYKYDSSGNVIQTSLPAEKIDKYLSSRTRKLKLVDYLLDRAVGDIDFCYIGVDDSSNGTSIQTNEINYIRSKIGGKGACFAATDELGLMGITRVVSRLYGGTEVGVTYYGGAEDNLADGFDFETLRTNVTTHIATLGCTISENAPLRVLVFTNANHSLAAAGLVEQAKINIQNSIPTIIIDPTYGGGGRALENALMNSDIHLTFLMGYSNWNTAGNAMGIALSNGIGRYLYLKNAAVITKSSHEGFLKAITFAYLKDISYKLCGYSIENPGAGGFCSYSYLLEKINGGEIVTGLLPFCVSPHGEVTCSNFRYPWNRAFEMTFDISVTAGAENIYSPGDVNGDGKINVSDYITLRLKMLGLVSLTGEAEAASDVNGDGVINALDYIAVRLHILGIAGIVW